MTETTKLAKFLNGLLGTGGKLTAQGVVNVTAGEVIGGALLGVGSIFNTTNLGGYMNPNVINGYSYNPADGNWYKP